MRIIQYHAHRYLPPLREEPAPRPSYARRIVAAVILALALLVARDLARTATVYEDGSGTVAGLTFCLPLAICNEGN